MKWGDAFFIIYLIVWVYKFKRSILYSMEDKHQCGITLWLTCAVASEISKMMMLAPGKRTHFRIVSITDDKNGYIAITSCTNQCQGQIYRK